ncbi:hypothetical protein ACFVGN_05595 [Streptomyces sp. NPDC057757]|uniref:hypothetical protein n=1 Tax=Streptomyces sp. NPDC057757 TaxID=3346241 RepID=UPI00369FE4DC
MPDQETATSVRTGQRVTTEVPTAEEAYTASLLREREGYARRGREDRIADVDAELERLGYEWEEKVVDDGEGDGQTPAPGDADADKGKDEASPPAGPEPTPAPQETAVETKPRRTARGAGKS